MMMSGFFKKLSIALTALGVGSVAAVAVSCAKDRSEGDGSSQFDPPTPPVLPPESTDALCSDGIDNDEDGAIDCCDLDCDVEKYPNLTVCQPDGSPEATPGACSDCVDNDGNGFLDCNDFSCSQNNPAVDCPVEDTDALCSDGIDNNDNGFVDCEDNDCKDPATDVCN